ncbi:hypothetical protein LPJ61_000204 [Coemansia biformis]|uniref:BAH domain-containing protein n=1 Tax=Coemansia biformis TaxID=1286918 RepID=A0A9W7YK34_9FUNG|nr:hypothetical protein LPJ61_000204 [Coemansia biformis]
MSSVSSADPGTPGSQGAAAAGGAEGQEALGSVEHRGRVYHVGDHVILEDADNTSGTNETELEAVGHIHGIQRAVQSGAVTVTVVWYMYPQLTPHPAYMEFYQDSLLRTFRQTTVPVERITGVCYVVSPSDAMAGHPAEWKDGERIFVCDLRFVDRGAFIQKLKGRNRGYWPESMDDARREMLTAMVRWPDGQRVLDKMPVTVQSGDDDAGQTPQTRRTTRLTSVPNSTNGATPHSGQDASMLSPSTPTPTPAAVHAQLLAYQQMLSQSQLSTEMGVPGQAPQPLSFMPPAAAAGQAPLSPFQKHQQQALGASFPPGSLSMAGMPYPQPSSPMSPVTPLQPGFTPKRRGRPPKNKQLIERRAMEDAAAAMAAAAAAASGQQPGPSPISPVSAMHRQAPGAYVNTGRPPPLSPLSASSIGSRNGTPSSGALGMSTSRGPFGSTQVLAMRGQPGATAAQTTSLHQHQQHQQQHHQHQQQQVQQPPAHPPPGTLQANMLRATPIPYGSASTEPQLPKAVVDMFPTVNGNIRWFATAPVRQSETDGVYHSQEYLGWRQHQQSSSCDV